MSSLCIEISERSVYVDTVYRTIPIPKPTCRADSLIINVLLYLKNALNGILLQCWIMSGYELWLGARSDQVSKSLMQKNLVEEGKGGRKMSSPYD